MPAQSTVMTTMMIRIMIESAQSTKHTGQQPAAPDGPHTSQLTHLHTYTLVDLHTYTLVDFKHSNEFTHILHVHVIIHLLLDRYFLAHEQLHIQHILASQCISTLPRAHMCTCAHCAAPRVTEPWLSVGDGGLMPLYISLHMAAPPSQPGVLVFISPNRMKSFTPQCLHTYLYRIQSYCCLPMTTRGLKVQVQISQNLMKPFTSLL